MFSRLSWWPLAEEYELARCDAANANGTASVYRVRQEWWEGSWFCFSNCRHVFTLLRRVDGASPGGVHFEAVARTEFDSTLRWVFWKNRHEWAMTMTDAKDASKIIASGTSHVYPAPGRSNSLFRLLSYWNVDASEEAKRLVPNWAATFMAALDEMEETEETDDDANPDKQG